MAVSEIVTYGGGETLKHVFNAVAMLMNGKTGALYQPIMFIGAMVGAVWAFGKAFWESSINGLIFQWMIPMVAILAVCIVPSTTVHIYDPILKIRHTVDNVPLGLARAAVSISTIGYGLTSAVEQAFAVPGNTEYSKTGMIFGAQNLLEMSHYAITNEKLLASMRDFVHNCVTFDLTFGLYSMDDLKRSNDIWGLISSKTSQVRMFTYCAPTEKRCHLVSCREGALQHLGPLIKTHCDQFKKHHMFQHLPGFYNQLTGMATAAIDVISQQVMMHAIIDATERKCDASGLGSNFAVRRAYMQQRHTYEVVGALAAKSLVILRNVFEALIYVAFIFIMPFAMVPQGFRIFTKWLWLLIWIQLWPPFYAILNSGIMMAAQANAKHIMGIDDGLTFMTSTGLHNLALDMETYAAYASLSVPFIAYAILQGGVGALVQMSSSITGVSQSAGATAAAEQTTGNYSYGQVGFDTTSAFNRSMNKVDTATNYSGGFFREDAGTNNYTVGADGKMVVNNNQSQLDMNINAADQISSNLTRASGTAYTHAEKAAEMYTKSMAQRNIQGADLVEHMSKGGRYDKVIAHGETESITQTSSKLMEQAESWGKQYGWDAKKSASFLSSVGVNAGMGAQDSAQKQNAICASLGIKFDKDNRASQSEVFSSAEAFNEKKNFAQNFQKHINATTNENASFHDEKGKRISISCNESFETGKNYQQQEEAHRQKAETLSAMVQDIRQKSVSINHNLNNEFVQYLKDEPLAGGKTRGLAGARMVAIAPSQERTEALNRFVDIKTQEYMDRNPALSTSAGFNKASQEMMAKPIAKDHDVRNTVARDLYMENFRDPEVEKEKIQAKNNDTAKDVHTKFAQTSREMQNTKKTLVADIELLKQNGLSYASVLQGKIIPRQKFFWESGGQQIDMPNQNSFQSVETAPKEAVKENGTIDQGQETMKRS